MLDQALLRPGRFDRRVSVERPDRVGRQQILGVHLRNKGLPLANDVSVEELAGMTTGFTGEGCGSAGLRAARQPCACFGYCSDHPTAVHVYGVGALCAAHRPAAHQVSMLVSPA